MKRTMFDAKWLVNAQFSYDELDGKEVTLHVGRDSDYGVILAQDDKGRLYVLSTFVRDAARQEKKA